MTPRTREQNEEIRRVRMTQIINAAADVYLDKGMLMEVRDVAQQAGLGYGTVYHYYKNKGDLLHDLLGQAMERASDLMYDIATHGNSTQRELKSVVVSLMEHWAQDHAMYLLSKLQCDDFRSLPGEQAVQLSAAYQEKMTLPLARIIGYATSSSLSDAKRKAQMLLAAMTGCALAPLSRGSLREDAADIADFLCEGLIHRKQVQT